jgi:hypothetical protein
MRPDLGVFVRCESSGIGELSNAAETTTRLAFANDTLSAIGSQPG